MIKLGSGGLVKVVLLNDVEQLIIGTYYHILGTII